MAVENRIEAYNLPLGVVSQLYREIAGAKPGMLSKVGLRTFVDPRQQGGRINECTTEDIVRLLEIDGEEWLFYSLPDPRRLPARHHRRPARQRHHGARGAEARRHLRRHGRA